MPAKKNQAAKSPKKIKKTGQTGQVIGLDTQTLHAALDAAPAAMVITRFDGRIMYANRQCREQYGFKREDLGRNIVVFFQDPDEYQSIVRQLRRKGRLDSLDVRAYGQGLARIWIMLSAQTIQLDGETVILASLSNVTGRKLLEEQNRIIAETQTRLLQTLDSKEIISLVAEKVGQLISRDGVVATTVLDEGKQAMRVAKVAGLDVPHQRIVATLGIDPYRMEGRLEDMTETELGLFRSGKLELLDGGLYALMTRRISKSLCKAGEKLLRTEKIYVMGFVWQQIHLGGLIILARCDISPYLETIGLIVNQATAAINRLRAEAALGEREAIFHNLFNNSEVGMIRSRLDGSEVLDMNEKYLKIFGRRREEMLGKPSLPHWADPKQREEMVERIKADGRVVDFECKMLDQKGEVHDCLTSLNLYRDEGIIEGSILDVTQSKRAEQALRESEERFRKVFEEGSVGMVLTSRNLQFFSANPAFCRMLGYTTEEMSKKTFLEVTHTDHREVDRTNVEKMWRGEIPFYKTEKRYIAKNGAIRWGSLSASIIRGQDGGPLYAVAMVEDITERKRAEEALRESEVKFRAMIEQASEGFALIDEEGLIIEWNKAEEAIWGLKREDVLGRLFCDVQFQVVVPERRTPERYEFFKTTMLEALRTGQSPVFGRLLDAELCRPDGTRAFIQQTASPIKTSRGYRLVSMAADVTERKRVEEALRENEEKFRRLFETSRDFLYVTDLEGRIVNFNKAASELSGYSQEELKNLNIQELYYDAREREALVAKITQQGFVENFSIRGRKKDGTIVDGLVSSTVIKDEKGNSIGFQGSIKDISELKRAEESLRESEARFKAIASNTPDHIIMQDQNLRYTMVINPQLGLTEQNMIGKTDHDFLSRQDADKLTEVKHRVLKNGEAVNFETSLVSVTGGIEYFDGSYVPQFDAQGRPNGLIGYFRNVTERKQAEEELKERMDELVAWQKATLGREGRVMELKNEINELLAELGRPPRYERQS